MDQAAAAAAADADTRCLQAALRRVLVQDMLRAGCSSATCRRLFGGADAICVKTKCNGALHSDICTLLRTFYTKRHK